MQKPAEHLASPRPAPDIPALDEVSAPISQANYGFDARTLETTTARLAELSGKPVDEVRAAVSGVLSEVEKLQVAVDTNVIPALDKTAARMLARMTAMVESSGGRIENGIFVTRPGVIALTAPPVLTPEARKVFGAMHLDAEEPEYAQLVHFKTAITNLTFPDEGKDTATFLDKVVGKAGHRSVTNDVHPVFLIAGVALETSLELIAHHEANVGRLTSSATAAMNFPLYELSGSVWEQLLQRREILRGILAEHDRDLGLDPRLYSPDGKEFSNRLHSSAKCTALTYSMGLKDFHKLFIGRFAPVGNEKGIQEVCSRMCEILNANYPLIISTPDSYRGLTNHKKYE